MNMGIVVLRFPGKMGSKIKIKASSLLKSLEALIRLQRRTYQSLVPSSPTFPNSTNIFFSWESCQAAENTFMRLDQDRGYIHLAAELENIRLGKLLIKARKYLKLLLGHLNQEESPRNATLSLGPPQSEVLLMEGNFCVLYGNAGEPG